LPSNQCTSAQLLTLPYLTFISFFTLTALVRRESHVFSVLTILYTLRSSAFHTVPGYDMSPSTSGATSTFQACTSSLALPMSSHHSYPPHSAPSVNIFGFTIVVATIIMSGTPLPLYPPKPCPRLTRIRLYTAITALQLQRAWRRAAADVDPEEPAQPHRQEVKATSILLRLAAYALVQVGYLM
jgi:hypothetical protein